MAAVRRMIPAVLGAFLFAAPLGAQATGSISGSVKDSASGQPIGSVSIAVEGTLRRTQSNMDGSYLITDIPAGSHRVTARRIGYGSQTATVTVSGGGTARQDFGMTAQAAALGEIVVTGYGTQRREAISGSVSTINADAANVGLITNASQMLAGRVGGVQMISNNGEPGAGVQIRVRGGTSISASNEPLYVVDGVPLQNESPDPGRPEIGGINGGLARNPLNSINPNDIESITVLKDASATAIYGSRGANGVVLIQTKRVAGGTGQMEYETYIGTSAQTKKLGLTSGDQYRAFITAQVASGGLPATADDPVNMGTANTDWEDEIGKRGVSTNHNLAFSGGSSATQYRASLNYFTQQGVVIANALERYQGRLNAVHDAFNGKLRLGVNMMAARVNNDFAPVENTGGFLGGLFTNMAIYNPTFPVKRSNGQYFEKACPLDETQNCVVTAVGEKNPVALAELWEDVAPEDRVLGNLTATYSLLSNLSSQTTLGTDRTSVVRETFAPRTSPAAANTGGYARKAERSLQNVNFQQLLTYSPSFGTDQELEVVGGYEYTKIDNKGFEAIMNGFITDAFGPNNLGAGRQSSSPVPTSYWVESQLVSFFSRANYGFRDKYYLTGVVRYDGSSRLAPGHRYATFPALSGSWRLSEEDFMSGNIFSTLSLRAGWGKQGNQAVDPYQTKLLLRADPGAIYPIGGTLTTGLRAAQVGNPDLTWETAEQINVGFDYGFMNERFTGVIDFYQKTTKDLLLEVAVPQPAVVNTRLENVGSLRNRGVEMTFNTPLLKQMNRTLNLEVVATAERNEVTSLGERTFINTGFVSGQGQSGQYSQRIMVGEAIGTFFAPHFLRVETTGANAGKQIYSCKATSAGCVNGETLDPKDDDRIVVGSANPDFTIGISNNGTWGSFDASWLWRGEFGGKVFNNTNLVYQTKSNATQGRNFLAAALSDADALTEPAKFSDRWIEDRTFIRLQNITIGYQLPARFVRGRSTRVFLSGDNLLLMSDYSGYDPEVYVASGLASRGIDYLTYPRARTFTLGARFQF